MENPNLAYGHNTKKTTNTYYFSTRIRTTNKAKRKTKRSKKNFETKKNQCVHSSRKRKQVKCENCEMENKSKLQTCDTCKKYKCKDCIKKEAVVQTTKKVRNPMKYVCSSCMLEATKRRVKPYPSPVLQSLEVKGNDNDDMTNLTLIEGNEITAQQTDHSSVSQNKVLKCQSCKCSKDSLMIMKTFYDLLSNVMSISDVNINNPFLMKNELFPNINQTVNPIIYSHLNFPLQTVFILCEDCLRNYMKNVKNFDKSIHGVNKVDNIDSLNCKETGGLSQKSNFVNDYSEKYKNYHLMFEATFNEMMKGNNGIISNNVNNSMSNNKMNDTYEDSIKENTLTLDSINKRSLQLIQELKDAIENLHQMNQLMQYPIVNYLSYIYQMQNTYRYPFLNQNYHLYPNPNQYHFFNQHQFLNAPCYNPNYQLRNFNNNHINTYQFNHP